MSVELCFECGQFSGSLHYRDGEWLCKYCYQGTPRETCRLFEYGHENPLDSKGSTAHVREIKSRRWDPVAKKQFHYEEPKTYFFPKG